LDELLASTEELARTFAPSARVVNPTRNRTCYSEGLMRIPIWLTLGVASLVIIFGLYRIRLFFRNADEEQRARQRKGMFSLAGRTHFLIGIIYLLLGGSLVATTFGWNPLAGAFDTKPAAKDPPAKAIRVEK
jgi:hypothetical protein